MYLNLEALSKSEIQLPFSKQSINELYAYQTQEYLLDIIFNKLISDLTITDYTVLSSNIDKLTRRLNLTSDALTSNETVNNILKEFNKNETRILLAGGKVIDFFCNKSGIESTGDFDLWCLNQQAYSEIHTYLSGQNYNLGITKEKVINVDCREYTVNSTCSTFVKNDHSIQLIFSTDDDDIDDIFRKFDFRCCCVAYDGKSIYVMKHALRDIYNRKIVVKSKKPTKAANTRLVKYINKGFTIEKGDLVMLVLGELAYMTNDTRSLSLKRSSGILRKKTVYTSADSVDDILF